MKRQIEAVEQVMARHPELRCTACNGTGRLKPSDTFKFLVGTLLDRDIKSVRCLACFGSGYVPPEDQIQ
jgi:hypothetical protein